MIALFIIITVVYAAKEISADGSTSYTNSLNSHVSNSNTINTNNNKPQRFLRWRATQESPIILTNEDQPNDNDGTYLKFNDINLRLYPVNLPPFEGQIGGNVYETYSNNEMDGIMRVLQAVLESHINSTLQETSMDLGSEEEDITKGIAAYVKLGNVKLVSASYSNNNYDLASESSEPVRSLKEERDLQSSKEGSITIQIEGGEVYYKYGLGGELLSTLPTQDELSSILIDSLESLPRSIQSTNATYTTSQVDNLGEDSDPNYQDLFFGMFDDVVESVPAVEDTDEPTRFPTTNMPTDEPTFNPITNAPTDQPSERPITESPISDAPVATPTTYSPTSSSPTTSIPTEAVEAPTVPAEEIPTPELPTTTFLPTEDVVANSNTDNKVEPITGQDLVAVIAEANSAANSKPDDEEGNNTTIILAASISGLVVIFAILALFVYKRRRSTSGSSFPLSSRSDDDDDIDGNGVVMKAVPLSSTIGSDDFNSSGEEGGLFNNNRCEKKTDQERDLESGNGNSGQGSSNAPKSQHFSTSKSNVQPSSQVDTQLKTQDQDEAYDKMLANAMVAGISKKRGSVQMANKSLMSSDTFAKAKPLPADTNEVEEEEEDTLDALAKGEPLGRHDSLTGAVQLTRDISDFDVLAGAAAAKEELVFDDIDEAMKLADIHINTVARNADSADDDEIAGEIRDDTNNKFDGSKRPRSCPPPVDSSRPPMAPPSAMHHSRPTTPSMMVRQDSFASRDILNDINAAAEKRRQIERQNGRSTPTDLLRALTPTTDVPKKEDANMIDAEPDANHDDIQIDSETQKEPEEENYSNNDILDTISQVVRSKEASTRGFPLTSSAKHGSAESTNIVSPSAIQERKRSSDPPGIITLEQNQDDLTLFTEMNTTEEQPTLARRAACGISNTLSNMVCKEGNGRQTPTKLTTMKWNPTLSNNRAPHYISDDDSSDEGDIISKPWMQKWNTDEFKEQTLVSPPVSNYDPDSEWDVSDAEIEEGTKEDDMRIW